MPLNLKTLKKSDAGGCVVLSLCVAISSNCFVCALT